MLKSIQKSWSKNERNKTTRRRRMMGMLCSFTKCRVCGCKMLVELFGDDDNICSECSDKEKK